MTSQQPIVRDSNHMIETHNQTPITSGRIVPSPSAPDIVLRSNIIANLPNVNSREGENLQAAKDDEMCKMLRSKTDLRDHRPLQTRRRWEKVRNQLLLL